MCEQSSSQSFKSPYSSIFASDPSKAYYEKLSLIWATSSVAILLIGVLGTGFYKHCDRNSYLIITILGCLPGIILPLLFPCPVDRNKPLAQRFWFKATIWIVIFGFYGNYFWTHYFYSLLGAKYLFDAHLFNNVPIICYIATFFYFTFYFTFSNIILRIVYRTTHSLPPLLKSCLWYITICFLAFSTALFEALSIQHFPLYTYNDRFMFLTVGSLFYGIYFVIGFPMFFWLDENQENKSSLRNTALNALAATAIVLLLLDLWRLYLGSIYDIGRNLNYKMPFIFQNLPTAGEDSILREL